ncbi:MAG: prolipoprotein diacylglyceryl transferase [Deltaproteobacteria bacterium]|nr:prolipoprotein diacylglyceryl transferase [Deltaproteobacteria bacterium]
MHPSLWKFNSGISWIGTVDITAYFLAVAVGMVLGSVLLWRWARRNAIDKNDALDLALWVAIFGLVGAKLMHVLADGYLGEYVNICVDPSKVFWDKWRVGLGYCRELHGNAIFDDARGYLGCVPTETNCLAWINLFAGGYTYYGGLIGGGTAAFLLIRSRKLPLWPTVDTLTWIVILGLGFGRLGCFLNGCCFGHVTDSWLGVVFPHGSPAWVEQGQLGLVGPNDAALPVLPTQLFEAFAAFGIAAFLALWVERKKRYGGETFVVGIALYAVARIVIEIWRADPRGGFLGLSTSQLVGIACLAGMIVLHLRLRDRGRPQTPETSSAAPPPPPPPPPASASSPPPADPG